MKFKTKLIILILLVVILSTMLFLYFKDNNSSSNFTFNNQFNSNTKTNTSTDTTVVTSSSQIQSSLTDKLELHATYYFDEIYVDENEYVKKDTKLLKYTNGEYLKAPYDLVITKKNIPDSDEMVTNSHYIEVSSNNNLKAQISVSETKINNISIGDSAKIKVAALDIEVEGVVTNISNTASNGKFTVTVEFTNPGNIMIGMSATVTI